MLRLGSLMRLVVTVIGMDADMVASDDVQSSLDGDSQRQLTDARGAAQRQGAWSPFGHLRENSVDRDAHHRSDKPVPSEPLCEKTENATVPSS